MILDSIWQDLGYGWRTLAKSPGFTAAAVLSLALGIGANTAVFSVVYAVLLRPLPYPEPGRLVRVSNEGLSIPEYESWKARVSAYASVAAHRGVEERNLGREWLKVMPVTDGFFRTLGVAPARGREFDSGDTGQAIILSDGLWRRGFQGNNVVGVLPRGFWFPQAVDAFVPLRPTGSAIDKGANTEVIARLKPDVTPRQAEAEYPGLSVAPYQEWLTGDIRLKLLLLTGAVGLLLLIACLNLASLLLARLEARQKELAVRLAVGGSAGRLWRQFFLENALLALGGSLVGLLGASWLLDGLVALVPFRLPVSLSLPVLGFTTAIALLTAFAFSLLAYAKSRGLDIHDTLRSGGRSIGADSGTRGLLVVGEVAFSVTLLVAAALLIQSLYRMHQERLGFTPQGLITFKAPPLRSGGDRGLFESALRERLRAIQGVRSAAAVNALPLTDQNNFPVEREGHPEQDITNMEIRHVTPGYFEALGIRLVRGRFFDHRDAGRSQPVIAVNEAVARRWWPRGGGLGDRVVVGRIRGKDLPELGEAPREVVAVVGDTKTVYLKEPPRPTVYVPSAQAAWYTGDMTWVVRADLSAGLAQRLRQAVADTDPGRHVERLQTMDEIVGSTMSDTRWDAWLFGSFAALALVLTAIGVYGLLSFSVARRTSEFGIRMALGAGRGEILKLVLKQGFTLIGVGLVAGLAGALALTRYLSGLLFGVRPTDPLSLVAVSALLLSVGMLASYLPARRATSVDPLAALRNE